MNLTNQITPSKEEIIRFLQSYPPDKPVTMVNILKFKDRSGNGEESGKEAYLRYSQNVLPLLEKAGGRLIWSGKVQHTLIGDYTSQPDMVLIVSYPSVQAFIDMSSSEEYDVISNDRKIALEYGGLLASTTVGT